MLLSGFDGGHNPGLKTVNQMATVQTGSGEQEVARMWAVLDCVVHFLEECVFVKHLEVRPNDVQVFQQQCTAPRCSSGSASLLFFVLLNARSLSLDCSAT